jgi:hypothetical protein
MKPTVFTKNGTMFEEDLVYSHEWLDTPDALFFKEQWVDKVTGELMRNNVHAYGKKAFVIGAEQVSI